MAVAMGFGQGNKNAPMSGSTGGGAVQLKMQPNGQVGLATDGSGGVLNYLKGVLGGQPAAPAASGVAQAATPAASGAAGAGGGF